jgi:hypothetical protein
MSDFEICVDDQPIEIEVPDQGPRGPAGTIAIGDVTTGAAGSDAEVVNVGTLQQAVLDITIPRGNPGVAATVAIGDVTTGAAGSDAAVVNAGTENAAVLDITIPRGNPGAAATITIGDVTTGAPGREAEVENVGTALAAILNFIIPRGDTGAAGADGIFSAIASQAEAEAGTENTKGMTALRVAQAIAALAGGIPQGTVVLTIKQTAPAGWLMFLDQTIGNTGSGAAYENADAQATFTDLYAYGDAECPLLTSAGGATTRAAQGSAADAWVAGCRMSMPKALGRALAIAGAGAGLTSRALGKAVGAETHTLSSGEQASMSVSGTASVTGTASVSISKTRANDVSSDPPQGESVVTSNGNTGSNVTFSQSASVSASGSISGTASGSNGSHNNMQPTAFIGNAMVKK